MRIEERLRTAYQQTSPPGEAGAYQRFLRLRARRARRTTIGAVLAAALVLGGAVAVPQLLDHDRGTPGGVRPSPPGAMAGKPSKAAPFVAASGTLGSHRWQYVVYWQHDAPGPPVPCAELRFVPELPPRRLPGSNLVVRPNLAHSCLPYDPMLSGSIGDPQPWDEKSGPLVDVTVQPATVRVRLLLTAGDPVELRPVGGPEAGLPYRYTAAALPAGTRVRAAFGYDRQGRLVLFADQERRTSSIPKLPSWATVRHATWLGAMLRQAGYTPEPQQSDAAVSAVAPDLLTVWATAAAPGGALAAAGYQPAGTVAGVPVHADQLRVVWPAKGGLVWAEPRPTPARLARLVAASQRLARP